MNWKKIDDFFNSTANILFIIVIVLLVLWFLYPYTAGKMEFYNDYYNSKH